MSDKTNDEKLRILKERLAQIQQKQEIPSAPERQTEEVIEINTDADKIKNHSHKKPLYSSWVLKVLFIGLLAYSSFYAYNNLGDSSNKEITEQKDFVLEYNINLEGDNIAIITSFKDESSAKALVNNLKIKGFKTNYLFLPNISNSVEKVYQVFIGPYENEEETNQWVQNIDEEVTIISLIDGTILRSMKSNKLIKREKAEKAAKEKAENERLAKEKAENERLAKEKAENERLAKEKAENERLAKEKAENEKLAKEKTENEERTKEKAKIEKIRLEEERLEKERIQLEKERKLLLIKNPKILISYTYRFISTVENEGILIINNNAGYPRIKQNFANIKSQGGKENIIRNIENDMNSYGALLDGIYFEKSGTIVPAYSGKITEVIW